MQPNDTRDGSLATSRPWLSVAGCLGGGVAGLVVSLVAVVVIGVLVFFPDLLQPSRQRQAVFLSALGELQEAPALRIATREISVRVEASVSRATRIRPWILPFGPGVDFEIGSTRVTLMSPENTAQYIVDLASPDGVPTVSFDGETVVYTLPPPRVDETLVEVQSDPSKLLVDVDRDWADHLLRDDRARNEALAAIRAEVVRAASSGPAMFEVREKGRSVVADMVRALVPEKWRGERIVVRWTDECDPD